MKLIEPNVELIKQEPDIEGIYKQIERSGRICYKSEDKITEDSAKKFVDMLINNGHGAMLEHGTVYLLFANTGDDTGYFIQYDNNPYSIATYDKLGYVYVTTNYRVLVENKWLDDLKYICEPTECHEKRYTLKFTTSIGITRELIRHRHFSFANESTRYCNYSKDKFGNEITFIEPYWLDDNRKFQNSEAYNNGYERFVSACEEAEGAYFDLLDEGFKPQEAREMLPLATKSEIIMTGFESDWEAFFKLRCDKAAHPDMQIIANKAKEIIDNEKVK